MAVPSQTCFLNHGITNANLLNDIPSQYGVMDMAWLTLHHAAPPTVGRYGCAVPSDKSINSTATKSDYV